MNMLRNLVLLSLIFFGGIQLPAQNIDTLDHILLALDDLLTVYNGKVKTTSLSISESSKSIKFYSSQKVGSQWSDAYTFCTRADTIKLEADQEAIAYLLKATNGFDTTSIIVNFYTLEPHFSNKHIKQYEEQATFETPEVFELINIALSLTAPAAEIENMIQKELSYHNYVQTYFASQKNHPLIDYLNRLMSRDTDPLSAYQSVRDYALGLDWKDNKVVYGGEYPRPFNLSPWFGNALVLLNDFAASSNFKNFYDTYKGYLGKINHEQEVFVDVESISNWLDSNFTGSFNALRILTSPLIANQTTFKAFEQSNYREGVMIMDAPDIIVQGKRSNAIKEALRSSILFTQMIAGYTSPYLKRQNIGLDEFSDSRKWIGTASSNQIKAEENTLFQVYFSNALFLVYVLEKYDEETYNFIYQSTKARMLEKYGLIAFPAFYDALQKNYEENKEDKTVEEMIRLILDWAGKQ